MRTLVTALAFLVVAVGPAFAADPAPAPVPAAAPAAAGPKDKAKTVEHIRHAKYPASKRSLVEGCNGMSDVSAEDKKWFAEALPEGEYKGAEDVIKALKL